MFSPALVLLMLAAAPPAAVASPATAPPAIQAQQSASGLIIAEDVAGRVTVYDTSQRIVFEMDKDSGRPVRIGVAPGTYEVRLDARRAAVRITAQVREGEYTVVDSARFAQPSSGRAQPAGSTAPTGAPAADAVSPNGPMGDGVNRIEVRLGVYPTPSFSHEEAANDVHRRKADLGLGFDYLRFIGRDIAIGVSASSLVRSETVWVDRDHDGTADDDRDRARTSNSTTLVFGVVRWNFARRLTPWRTLEPYVSGSLGPVFRWNQKKVEIHDDDLDQSTEVITGFGGRVGAGIDVHLGRVFTLGVVGAWNWSTCEDETIGYGSEDRGGGVAVTMGFDWGSSKKGKK
jgi:hypothetical protein